MGGMGRCRAGWSLCLSWVGESAGDGGRKPPGVEGAGPPLWGGAVDGWARLGGPVGWPVRGPVGWLLRPDSRSPSRWEVTGETAGSARSCWRAGIVPCRCHAVMAEPPIPAYFPTQPTPSPPSLACPAPPQRRNGTRRQRRRPCAPHRAGAAVPLPRLVQTVG